jgi:predicted PurR-regulated permease PerM
LAKETRSEHLKLSVVIAAALLVLCVFLFWPVMKTLLFAATVAVVLTPFYRWVQRRLWGENPRPWKQALGAGAVVTVTVAVLLILLAVAVVIVIDNFDLLKNFAVQVAALVQGWLGDSLGLKFDFKQAVADRADALFGYVRSMFFAATDFFIKFVIFIAALYFCLRSGGELVENVRRSLSQSHREVFDRFVKSAYSVLYAIYVVHVGTAVITFVLALPFFALIGYSDHLFFWSLLCCVFQLVPLLGPSIIMFSISAYAFATDDTTAGVLCLALGYPVVAVVPDVVFRPIMMGRGVKLSPLLLLLGFIGGVASMGAIGFVLGPLALTLLAESLEFASERMRSHYGAEGGANA